MISLNYRDARPIYEQVKDGLRHLVMAGAIQPGDMLPPVRALASSLAINPNTIQRAYEALEGEGYLYTVAGKGAFAGCMSIPGRNIHSPCEIVSLRDMEEGARLLAACAETTL